MCNESPVRNLVQYIYIENVSVKSAVWANYISNKQHLKLYRLYTLCLVIVYWEIYIVTLDTIFSYNIHEILIIWLWLRGRELSCEMHQFLLSENNG